MGQLEWYQVDNRKADAYEYEEHRSVIQNGAERFRLNSLAGTLFSPTVLVLFMNPQCWSRLMESTLGSFFHWLFTWQLQFCCLDLLSHVEDCLVFLARPLIANNYVETAIIWFESNNVFQVSFCLLQKR